MELQTIKVYSRFCRHIKYMESIDIDIEPPDTFLKIGKHGRDDKFKLLKEGCIFVSAFFL